jgi:hypothetical protein
MEKKRSAHRLLMVEPGKKRTLRRPKPNWVGNITINLGERV